MNFLKFFFPHFSENFTRADLVLESGFLSYLHHASCIMHALLQGDEENI